MVKNLPANAGDVRDAGLTPELGRSPGGGHGNPLQYCLENPMDRRAWWATVHRVTKSRTQLKQHNKYMLNDIFKHPYPLTNQALHFGEILPHVHRHNPAALLLAKGWK